MEGDEDAVMIAGGKLILVVERHSVRPPMGGKCGGRSDLAGARANAFAAVAAVFRRKNKLLHYSIVVALGPAIVAPGLQKHQLFGRLRGFLFRLVEIRPICMQLVSPVL